MNEQVDPMNEQPNDQRDRQDIVSADPTRDATPGVKPAPQGTPPMNPPMNPPVDTRGASVNQQNQEASPAQRPQQNAVDTAIPAFGEPPERRWCIRRGQRCQTGAERDANARGRPAGTGRCAANAAPFR